MQGKTPPLPATLVHPRRGHVNHRCLLHTVGRRRRNALALFLAQPGKKHEHAAGKAARNSLRRNFSVKKALPQSQLSANNARVGSGMKMRTLGIYLTG